MSTATALVREGLGFSLLPASCTAVFNIGEQCAVIAIDQPGKRSIGLLQRKPVAQSPSLSQFMRSEEHTSELQSLMRISYAVFCLKKKTKTHNTKQCN